MDKITIGLLLPSSTIFPIGKDFEKGLKEGLKAVGDKVEVEIIKDFIGQGDLKLVEKACNKFFNYDDVNLVTGIVSNLVASEVSEKFQQRSIPLLVNNLGGHIPNILKLNKFIFINSPHLWRHAYTMGHWGVKEFGKKGMYISAVYDAGYSFSQMFYEGMMAADAGADWSFSVPPMPPPGGLTDMSIIFPFLEQYQPDFIFATFCGTETTLFLNEFIARGWHNKTKVLGLPYLLAPFAPLNDDIIIHTTVPFEEAPDITPDKVFYELGFQNGQTIAQAASSATSADQLQAEIAKLSAMFNTDMQKMGENQLTLYQNHIKVGEGKFEPKQLKSWDTFSLEVEKIRPLNSEIAGGWNNPYLCI